MIADTAQLVIEVTRRVVTVFGILCQAAVDDPAQWRRHTRIERWWVVRDDRREGLHRLAFVKRFLASRHFEEHEAERELVRAMIDGLAAGLLRAHVADRADDHAGHGVM